MNEQSRAMNRAIRAARGMSVTVGTGTTDSSRALMAQLRGAAGMMGGGTWQAGQATAQTPPLTNAGAGTGKTQPRLRRDMNYYIRKAFER